MRDLDLELCEPLPASGRLQLRTITAASFAPSLIPRHAISNTPYNRRQRLKNFPSLIPRHAATAPPIKRDHRCARCARGSDR